MFSGKKNVRTVKQATRKAEHEVYLRQDIGCGIVSCVECLGRACQDYVPNIDSASVVMIPDTNIILHNMNILEDARMVNIVLLETVLNETRNRNKAVYARLQTVMADAAKHCFVFPNDHHEATHCVRGGNETPNDFCDRCIRVAVHWYARHLSALNSNGRVLFVTHDKAQRQQFSDSVNAAERERVLAVSLRQYIDQALGSSELEAVQMEEPDGMKESPTTSAQYSEYITTEEVERGILLGTYFKGKLKTSETSCFFGEIRGKWNFEQQKFDRILIPGRINMNRAIHDDTVAVDLLPCKEWRARNATENCDCGTVGEALAKGMTPCGRVVSIVAKRRRPYCGSIEESAAEQAAGAAGNVTVLFQPKNFRIPRIRLMTRQTAELRDKRLSVVIDEWPTYCSMPLGHYVEVLGKIGDKDTEAKVILIENDVPHYDFSEAVYDCLPKGEWKVEATEERNRKDLRHLPICSVDPVGCKDIDDALHYRLLPNGNEEVGVHIADVSHFLLEQTAMDLEAQKRSTSVYLVDRRIDMLPKLLTENLCSIVGGEDRYAFSIVWEFDADFKIVNEWFGKSIIRSRAALNYGLAQKMIDDESDSSELSVALRGLMRLSRTFKESRVKAGALFLASQEFKFKLDNDHVNPTDMTKYQTFEANSMVEEWMLYANAAAAKKVLSVYPRCTLLRRHQPPAEDAFDTINAALKRKLGVVLDASSSFALNCSLDLCVIPDDPFFNELVRMLVTRCLRQAQYFSSGEVPTEEYYHYGLAMPIYTHFTSPIRRYADVIVHRQLAAALGVCQLSEDHFDEEKMAAVASNINYRHEQAQKAGRDSQNLYTGYFLRNFQDGIPLEKGYVVRVTDSHVFVLVAKYGQEGRVAKDSLKREYQLLDAVTVKIALIREGDVLRTRLEYSIEEASSNNDSEEPPIKKART